MCPNEIIQMWELVKEALKQETSSTAFELWYGDLVPERYDPEESVLVFATQTEFKQKHLTEKCREVLEDHFLNVAAFPVHIVFVCYNKAPSAEEIIRRIITGDNSNTPTTEAPIEDGADKAQRSRYTFDNFIVGESNKFAHAACLKVAHHPAFEWNPLFIYGPSGVGKTHLMYAVINEMRQQIPNTKVIYTKGDDFLNYMIDCMSHQAMPTFHDHYRNCDVLLVDDIQFISGKVSTQEEFFNTFQTLFEDGKQIILASDRPPRDINPLEERLRSRFEQGLLADINLPNMELRIAILKKKAEDMHIDLPNEVLTYLAENLRSNIRQIEGAIKKLAAKSLIDGRHITMELARDCIADMLGDAEPLNITIDKVFAAVFGKYNVSKEDLLGNKRTKGIAMARHIAIYLIREITEISLPRIGSIFGRDHATILASTRVVEKRMAGDALFAMEIENLKKDVLGR